jgi:ABC-2 type transport system ATP-binding protein
MEQVIETDGLSCKYGRLEAVRDLTLGVPAGSIFALLGPNGAGKTTTVNMLMNLVRPTRGHARVLGVDSRHLGPSTLSSIGYVSESQQLPEWMTVRQLIDYCRPLYPTWDATFAEELRTQFDLDPQAKLRRLSRGMKVKAALLVSLAYRPKLLVLDEPFTGLDPVVRDDLVRGVLRMAEQAQWTVFLSSHDMEEVERLADVVGFLDGGRLHLVESAAALLRRFRRVEVALAGSAAIPGERPASWLGFEAAGRAARFVESEAGDDSEARLRAMWPGATVEILPMSLREIFIAIARKPGGLTLAAAAPGGSGGAA